MRATEWPDRVLDNWVGLLVDTVSVLISLSAATAIRFGTLGVTQYLAPLWPAVVLLLGVRLGFLQALGLHNAPSTVFGRRRVISLVAAVALSSLITGLLILGLTAPFGRAGWFPFSLLLLELPLGVICGAAVRLGWRIWEQSIVPKWARELEVLRSRAGTILSGLFIALAVVVLWQAVGLAAALLPGTWESVLAGFRVSILSAVLFLVPGYALLALARPRMDLGPLEGLIVSAGLSVAVVPLLLYFCSLAGIQLNSFSVGAIFILLGALALWRSLPQMRRMVGNPRLRWARREWRVRLGEVRSLWTGGITEGQAFYTALALVFLMAFLVRFYVVKDLIVPPGSDSVHHTMITQLLVDNGGLFSSWEPYAPLITFTYHFGFHSLAAFYHWLTGVTVIKSVILTGQIINFLSVPLVYVLTVRLTKSRWAGLFAAVIPGFLCLMPMYYVNWGRYTQLAGQTVLPVAIVFTLQALFGKENDQRVMAITAVALAGLVLTHYRVALMYVCFLIPVVLYATYENRRRGRDLLRTWLKVGGIATVTLVLVTPWLCSTLSGTLDEGLAATVDGTMSLSRARWLAEYTAISTFSPTGDIFFFLPGYLWVASTLGAVWGISQRRTSILITPMWVGALVLLANPHVLGLPGTGLVNNATMLMAFYMPAAILAGFLLGRLIEVAKPKVPRIGRVAALVALLVVVLTYGDMLSIVVPESIYVTDADERAMGWIRANTDTGAKFLASPGFFLDILVGSDAGWWIPLLAERQATVPPMTYTTEGSLEPDYAIEILEFNRTVHNSVLDDMETVRLLRENGVSHVYIGEKGGNLQVQSLANSPCYELVYHEDGVWIFHLLGVCHR